MLPSLIPLIVMQTAQPVLIARRFTAGEQWKYSVVGRIQSEVRRQGTDTWLPEEEGAEYGFTVKVNKVLQDGSAEVHYSRPTFTEITGETYDAPEKRNVEKINQVFLYRLSIANEVLESKDLAPKKAKPGEEGEEGPGLVRYSPGGGVGRSQVGETSVLKMKDTPSASLLLTAPRMVNDRAQGAIESFLEESFRLALNVGAPDGGMDLAPRLSFEKVAVGDTWKRTVSYQPQVLKGKGTIAVQRLDYTYRYDGPIVVQGQSYERIHASLSYTTDLAAYFHQVTGLTPEQTRMGAFPLRMDMGVDFDLDKSSHRTVRAVSASAGDFSIFNAGDPKPYYELKFKGNTTMTSKRDSSVSAPPKVKRKKN